MLKKLCDNCQAEMDIDNEGFRIEINSSTQDEVIELFGDLCEKCEKELIGGIKKTLSAYGIKSEETQENEELNEDSY